MQRTPGSLRNKLMALCALVVAVVLATPAAMARDHYRGHGDDSADLLGALVVGAVIGGVLVSASQHHDRYYGGGSSYPQGYPQPGYYGGYPASYAYPGYPTYGYGGGGYYSNYPSYGGGVNVGVVYSNHEGRYYNRPRSYYRGDRGYGGGYRHGDRGRYYSRHGH